MYSILELELRCLLLKLGRRFPYCNQDQGTEYRTAVKVHNVRTGVDVFNIGTGIEVPTIETGT